MTGMEKFFIAATTASTALNIAGKQKENQASVKALRNEANLLDSESAQLEQSNKYEQDKLRAEKKLSIGRAKNAFAKSGVKMEGSPLEILADIGTSYEMDINALKYNTKVDTDRLRNESRYRLDSAKKIRRTGFFETVGAGLQGATQIASFLAPRG